MRLKKILWIVLGLTALYGVYLVVSLLFLPSVEALKNRRMNMGIKVRDWKGNYHPFLVGPKNRYWTPSHSIPPEMKWAVILAEDSRFYTHEGIDVKAIKNAIKYDLEKKSLSRGASTITQQVAKNLFLSREKSINRKIKEIILAKRMEQTLTKGRIIELYLNVVELGPMVYGVGHGARYYFGKPVSSLTPRECAFLAAMLPGPRIAYNPYRNMAKVVRRSDIILKLLKNKGILTDSEYHLALAAEPNISGLQKKIDETIKKEEVFANISGAVDAGSGSSGNAGGEATPAAEAQGELSPGEEVQPGNPEISPEEKQTEPK
ncbi:MAG: biosynthetic peptidoglycan transglycosylase [Deltaproteobacteria bacterium]